MSEDLHDSNNVSFRIAAMCSRCKVVYDATAGIICPRCQSTHPDWATKEEVPFLTPDWSGHDADIAWCEALHKLEDNREY